MESLFFLFKDLFYFSCVYMWGYVYVSTRTHQSSSELINL